MMKEKKEISIAALLSLLLVAIYLTEKVNADGCHVATEDIGTELGLADDICSINDALGKSPPDFVTAKAYYRLGYGSPEPNLKDIATGEFVGNYSEASAELFGNATWIDERLQLAYDGEDIYDTDTKRVQFIKKILQASLLGARMLSNLEIAYAAAEDEDASEALLAWELALANHYGLDSKCAIFANGQARGIEFGVMEKGVSIPNDEIGDAFGEGGRLLNERSIDLEDLREQIDIIERNFVIIYLQAVVKYGTLVTLEGDNVEKAQAEGFAYYHAIAAIVYNIDEDAHDTIIDCLNIAQEPDKERCETALDLIPDLIEELEINSNNVGDFDSDRVDEYEAPEELACEAYNPFNTDDAAEAVDSDR